MWSMRARVMNRNRSAITFVRSARSPGTSIDKGSFYLFVFYIKYCRMYTLPLDSRRLFTVVNYYGFTLCCDAANYFAEMLILGLF